MMTPELSRYLQSQGVTIDEENRPWRTDNEGRMRILQADGEDPLARYNSSFESLASAKDSLGRPRFGSEVYTGLSNGDGNMPSYAPVNIDGVDYIRGMGTFDESYAIPAMRKVYDKYGVTPNDFAYSDKYGSLLRADVGQKIAEPIGKALGNGVGGGFFGKDGVGTAFSQTIGLAMGLSSLAAAGLGAAASAGSASAASALAESGYQSLWSSLAENAASQGGSLGDIMNTFTPGGGSASLPPSYDNMLAQAGDTLNDAGPQSSMNFPQPPGESVMGGNTNMTGFIKDVAPFATGAASVSSGISPFITNGAPAAAGGSGFSGLSLSNIGTGLGAAGAIGAGVKALGGGGLGGSTSQTSTTNLPPMSEEERQLIQLNAELTKRQLAAIDTLQPFQKAMLEDALAQMQQQSATDRAVNAAVSPEEQAALARQNYDSALKLGPIQDEIAQRQLDAIRLNGAATPEQEALIKRAADAGIAAGSGDIDAATSRGIGLIKDELANSRGLRLSDSPMSGEAALLAREGEIQKGSLTKNLRANEANAKLSYPLAAQGVQTASSNAAAQIAQAAKDFQSTLQQRAFANRLALTGQASSTGIGLASTGGGNGALSALNQSRLAGASTTTDVSKGIGLSDAGALASGIGSAMYGFNQLFPNGF